MNTVIYNIGMNNIHNKVTGTYLQAMSETVQYLFFKQFNRRNKENFAIVIHTKLAHFREDDPN